MICTSISNKGYEEILDILASPATEMAEIRLDLCRLSDEQIEDLFGNSATPLLAISRKPRETKCCKWRWHAASATEQTLQK